MQHNRQINKTGAVEYTKDTHIVDDSKFYSTLAHYSPLFHVQKGTPIFLSNRQGPSTHLLMLIINTLAILESISLWSALQDSLSPNTTLTLLFFVNILSLLITDLSYLLTITLNPGIRNLCSISDQEYSKNGKEYCIYCQNYKTYKMYHCVFCQACILNFDHHCNILNRCIGGPQKKYFCIFILFLGISFFSLLVCGIYSVIVM